jgi:hypothetical protein
MSSILIQPAWNDFARLALIHISERERVEGMTVKKYVLRRLSQGETDLKVLARQTRIQFPSRGISFSYIRSIRNEWLKASASRRDEGEKPSGSGSTHL